MKSDLFIANTQFQIIMSIIIKNLYIFNDADIIISDKIYDANTLAKQLERAKTFDQIRIYRCPRTKIEQLNFQLSNSYYSKLLGDRKYNRIFVCLSGFSNELNNGCYNICYCNNSNLKVCGYIEGYSSYTESVFDDYSKFSFGHKIAVSLSRILFRKKYITEFDTVYAFRPSLFYRNMPYSIVGIPDLNLDENEKIRHDIFATFNYKSVDQKINERFIFFEESFSEDNGTNSDLQIVERISKIVGKDNLIIKRHPRNKINRFSKLGYKTIQLNSIPWEVYAMDSYQPEHVLITYSSGAALNFRFLSNIEQHTILLYKCFKDSHFFNMSEDTKRWFEDYSKLYSSFVHIPIDQDDLNELINKYR